MRTVIFLAAFLLFLVCGCKKDDSSPTDPPSQQNTVTDIDGNVYKTVTIGKQVWMAENLKVTKYRNGDAISNITDNLQWYNMNSGSYCKYDNSVGSGNTYGYLYNFFAINDNRKIAPLGWHVPTAEEWNTLINNLGSPSDVGGYLKESGTSHWNSPNEGVVKSVGFIALPGGRRDATGNAQGVFVDIGDAGFWWTSSREGTLNPHNISMGHSTKAITAGYGWPTCGYSVRCVKD